MCPSWNAILPRARVYLRHDTENSRDAKRGRLGAIEAIKVRAGRQGGCLGASDWSLIQRHTPATATATRLHRPSWNRLHVYFFLNALRCFLLICGLPRSAPARAVLGVYLHARLGLLNSISVVKGTSLHELYSRHSLDVGCHYSGTAAAVLVVNWLRGISDPSKLEIRSRQLLEIVGRYQ